MTLLCFSPLSRHQHHHHAITPSPRHYAATSPLRRHHATAALITCFLGTSQEFGLEEEAAEKVRELSQPFFDWLEQAEESDEEITISY